VTKSSEQKVKIQQLGKRTILYDAALIEHPDEALFQPYENPAVTITTAPGRGEAVFYQHGDLKLVLRHYQRGGMIAAIMGDRYLGYVAEKTRSFREWCLLKTLQTLGLPAPIPVAASFTKAGLFCYRADLVTVAIPGTETLADYLFENRLDAARWQQLGKTLRAFHDKNIYHADLNARNILLDDDTFYLIDFDKGMVRYIGNAWKASNLARLQRSLLKFKNANTEMHFTPDNWKQLIAGYMEEIKD
jgi:tRNA A-37 threonylcarbamoyl transferase component Bud32